MQLRPYQLKSVIQISNSWKHNQTILFDSKTGSGKTIIAKAIIKELIDKYHTVLFTANRRSLITQTAEKFDNMKEHISIIMGKDKKKDPKYFPKRQLQIGTLQSLVNRKNEIKPDVIFFDEVHYGYKGTMLQGLLKAFPKAKVIGMSATPINDKGYLLEGFDDYIKGKPKQELIDLGYLVKMICFIPIKFDLSDIEIKTTGDYDNNQLEDKLNKKEIMANLVDEWCINAYGRKTIVFCVNIKHAESMKEEFLEIAENIVIIHSLMKQKEIDENIKTFIETKDCIMINVNMFTTGNDVSDIGCVIIARPTKILRLYEQMVGRGSRIHEGKEHCIFIDAGNCIEEHGFPDEERVYELEPVYTKSLDAKMEVEREYGDEVTVADKKIAKQLVKVSNLAEIYANKEYALESEFQTDVRKILSKFPEIINWRQNSGKIEKKGQWVMFTSLPGLPDISCLFLNSIYIGLELKIVKVKREPSDAYLKRIFTKNQKKTLPLFLKNNVFFFVIKDCSELFDLILWLKKKIKKVEGGVMIEEGIMKIQDEFYFNIERLKVGLEI